MSAVIAASTRVLVPQRAVAYVVGCDPATVRRRVPQVACDVRTRQVLYDLADVAQLKQPRPYRVSRLRTGRQFATLGGTDDACPKPAHQRAAGFCVSGGTMPEMPDEPATMKVRPVIDETAVAEFAAEFADRVAERVEATLKDRMRRMGLTVDIN